MAQVIADRRDIDFVLYEQFNIEELTQHAKFAEFNKKTFDLNAILPITMGKMNAIEAADPAAVEIPEAAFGG